MTKKSTPDHQTIWQATSENLNALAKRRCCIIQQSDKSLGIKQLTTTESTEHAEKRDKTARFAPL